MTPAISDGNTQGTRGMRYSLMSRDWIADCVEARRLVLCEFR